MPKPTDVVKLEYGFTRNQSITSQAITSARTKMSAAELKVFYQVSTLIKQGEEDFLTYEVGIKEFVEKLGFSDTNIDFVKKICRGIVGKTFEIETENKWEVYVVFKSMSLDKSKNTITMRFNDDMKPFLLALSKNFTKIHAVKYINSFESKYAIRIYALLKDFRCMTHRDIEVEALAKMLELPKSYSTFKDIRVKVLEPAWREINEKSDIEIYSIEAIEKERKKITKIRINFGNKLEKRESDIIKYLNELYRKAKSDPLVFRGFYFSVAEKPTSKYELFKITDIEVDDRPYYSAKSEDKTALAMLGKKDFVARLITGIKDALVFIASQEKQTQLDLGQWQSEQDSLAQIKSIVKRWRQAQKQAEYMAYGFEAES